MRLTALRPRYMRVSIQEFLRVSPGPGGYDWSRADAYLEAFARTGAQLVVSFNLKPSWLFPSVDHEQWRPTDTKAWRTLIGDVVRRYSVERSWVSHWEASQEPDIGELGGTPFKIVDARDYWGFYMDFADVIEAVAPEAKIGGPGVAFGPTAEPLPGFVALCKERGTRLDFVSWHLYKNAPERHTQAVAFARNLLNELSPIPQLMLSEWNSGFSPINVVETSNDPAYDALVAANLLEYFDSGADSTFLYHAFDQAGDPADFSGWFSPDSAENVRKAWSDSPLRLGILSEDGSPRGRYFVYQALADLGTDRVSATCSDTLRALAARTTSATRILIVNADIDGGGDRLVNLNISGIRPGRARFSHARLDGSSGWRVLEGRDVYIEDRWMTDLLIPSDSVTQVSLRW
ncbi:MAG: xylan 1,4-beta-xylosidase [Actinomycetota bacterium]|nr:xylan 1,4-beta-xylosidase [Actinomycetota bacterium]